MSCVTRIQRICFPTPLNPTEDAYPVPGRKERMYSSYPSARELCCMSLRKLESINVPSSWRIASNRTFHEVRESVSRDLVADHLQLTPGTSFRTDNGVIPEVQRTAIWMAASLNWHHRDSPSDKLQELP